MTGKQLRAYRLKHGPEGKLSRSRAAFATEFGISEQAVKQYETGQRRVPRWLTLAIQRRRLVGGWRRP